ncbi:hypothetical protein Smal_2528 [Stenotrophomonas maltophilia R551-3]|uniref:Uncharacterized protein n=1 Tax=Stenotrophomonas maltophilia (strain R551-3) TaxID=391008 RepID=B4SNK3_STRM5|nr:hypothetical protein Smal_2528 [Stenotrophomonas maltophilia R551-3]
MTKSLARSSILLLSVERCSSARSHHISQSKAFHSNGTCLLNNYKISSDQRQQELKGFIQRSKIFRRCIIGKESVALLCDHHKPVCPQQAARDFSIQVVQPIPRRSGHWESKPVKILEERSPISAICHEKLLTDAAAYKDPNSIADEAKSSRNFSGDLSKQQELFGFLSVLPAGRLTGIAGCFTGSNPRRLCTSAVRGNAELPHRKGRRRGDANANPSDNQGSYGDPGRTSTKQRRPGVPPHNAVALARRPTCTEAIPPAHSVIPLWTGRHSAMPPRSAEITHG